MTTKYQIKFTADTEGNWCSQCAGTYTSREEAEDAIAADPTAGPDCYGNECYPEVIEIDED